MPLPEVSLAVTLVKYFNQTTIPPQKEEKKTVIDVLKKSGLKAAFQTLGTPYTFATKRVIHKPKDCLSCRVRTPN